MDNHEKRFQNAFIAGLIENGWVYSWQEGCAGYDRINAVISSDILTWLETTQSEKWDKLVRSLAGDLTGALALVVEQITRFRESPPENGGTYNLFLEGITVRGIKFDMFHAEPATRGNGHADLMYENMIFRVVSEFPYSLSKTHDAIDLGFFINGVPVGTAELKSPVAGQGVGEAEKQYRDDRIPGKDMVLNPSSGALFHFAVATDLASMTTALRGDKTQFIPFNTGIDNNAWAESHPADYPTSYIWKEVLERRTFTMIISGMMRNVVFDDVPQTRFPRYHQLDNLK
ncbi:MAG TPA: type I restriction endonuclease, partial [Anaerolineaceae bacterium]|nr:type I restriction endonuclease [Anaerolineaceae bacterium]